MAGSTAQAQRGATCVTPPRPAGTDRCAHLETRARTAGRHSQCAAQTMLPPLPAPRPQVPPHPGNYVVARTYPRAPAPRDHGYGALPRSTGHAPAACAHRRRYARLSMVGGTRRAAPRRTGRSACLRHWGPVSTFSLPGPRGQHRLSTGHCQALLASAPASFWPANATAETVIDRQEDGHDRQSA